MRAGALAIVVTASVVFALAPKKPLASAPARRSVAPTPRGEKIVSAHAPFQDGDCALCHARKDPKNPGRITMPVAELCFSCHEEMKPVMEHPYRHEPATKDCTLCHNPHDATASGLLVKEQTALCFGCHEETKAALADAGVMHLPVIEGDKCVNCHNPHAADVEQLLRHTPYELCVSCHGLDDVRDLDGVKLANVRKAIEEGKMKHGAVKDCTGCHSPHGSANFRLLVDAYPADFYAPFDPANYALCFECHKPDIVREPQTTTLTSFRDGDRNLHFVHVNREERGRTCRACHEVHAAGQWHLIRDSVPYGPRGFLLELNFKPLPDGGECSRTCHVTKAYNTRFAVNPPKPKD